MCSCKTSLIPWLILISLFLPSFAFGMEEHFPDVSIGPKASADGYIGFEVSLYDLFLLAPLSQNRSPYKFGFVGEGVIYRNGPGNQFGFGVEYFACAHRRLRESNLPLSLLFPNPQVMISRYSDGEFGISASLFFMLLAIPFLEWDFKEKQIVGGVMLKFPILGSMQ